MATEGKRGKQTASAARRAPRRASWLDRFAFDRDAESRLLLVGGAVLLLVLVLGVIGFGYWDSVVRPRHRTVLAVNGQKVSYSAMQRRMEYEFTTTTAYQQQGAISLLPQNAADNVETELLLITRAESDQGISVTGDEYDQHLKVKVGVATDASPEQFQQAFRRALDKAHLKESEYRRLSNAEVLREKVQNKIQSELPATVTQAKYEVIGTTKKEDADAALARVKAGEDWATVAKQLSTEPDKDTTGGIHDYAPDGTLPAAYNDYVFSTQVGQISDPPISQDLGNGTTQYYIIRVVDRSEQPLKDDQKPAVAGRRYSQWLDDMKSQSTIINKWDDATQAKALSAIIDDLIAIQREQQQQQQQPITVPTVAATAIPPAQSASPAVPDAPVAPGAGNGQ
ncbi:MAG TPA: peptidylprolyl isomerase [Dehalococcoidia bacterium]|nr:peptidylprolyl isomerase [Dehalococcoidia bacterium]